MQVRKTAIGFYEITDTHFRATVQLNARDCMNAGTVLELPEDASAKAKALTDFREIFYKQFGGKSSLRFKNKSTDDICSFNLQNVESSGAVLTTRQNLTAFIAEMKKKEKVSTLVKKIDEEKEYELISDPKKLAELSDEIYLFKKDNAGFANDALKQKKGIYSSAAEKDKNANPSVKQFVLRHCGKIIATNMYFTSEDVTYESDIIVHQDYQNKGFCQAMMLKGYEDILKNPNVELAWIIAGGDGKAGVGVHLYRDLLKAKPIDEIVAREQGFVISYMKEGPRLLQEANRDLVTGFSLDRLAEIATKKMAVVKSSRTGMFATLAVIGVAAVTVGVQIAAHVMRSKKV